MADSTTKLETSDDGTRSLVGDLPSLGELDVVDDAELLRLAEQPARPLLPVLDRSSAMWPLIVVFALMPVTFAAYYRTFDATAAEWGLRAVDVLSGTTRAERVFPGTGSQRFAAPLSTWSTAVVVDSFPRSWPTSVIIVSVLATTLTGFGVYVAFRHLAGARFALWTTLLVCCHPLLLAAATTPAPRALGCCLQVLAFGCLLRHGLVGGRVIGVWNVAVGVLLGGTLLASGPFFVVGVTTTVWYAVLRTLFGRPPGSVESKRPALRSAGAVGVVVGIALLVGGWWIVWSVSGFGGEAWRGWMTLVESREVAPRTGRSVVGELVERVGLLFGFVVCGGWRCLQLVRHEESEPRRVAALLLAWTSTSVVGCLVVTKLVPRLSPEAFAAWELTTVVPLAALAVVGVDAVRDRTIGLLGTTLITLVSIFVWGSPRIVAAIGFRWWGGFAAGWLLLAAAFASGVLLWTAWQGTRASDRMIRPIIGFATFGIILAQVTSGIVVSRRTTGDDRALVAYQLGLAGFDAVDRIYVVGTRSLDPRVQYAVRSLWPRSPVEDVPNRDSAVAAIIENVEIGRRAVLVDTRDDNRPFDNRDGRFEIVTVAPRRLFERHRLRAHVLTSRDPAAVTERTADGNPGQNQRLLSTRLSGVSP